MPIAPIVPDAHFLRLSKDPDRPNELTIDYDAIIAEAREAIASYNKEAQRLMSQRHGDKYRPDMPLDSDIGQVLGDRPAPVEPWIAAKQGNKYVLGLTQVVDVRLAPFLNLKGEEDEEPNFADEPDFSDDLEAQFDPDATGGTRVPLNRPKSGGVASLPNGGYEVAPKSDWATFLKERKAEGKTMGEASAEWRKLKADAA